MWVKHPIIIFQFYIKNVVTFLNSYVNLCILLYGATSWYAMCRHVLCLHSHTYTHLPTYKCRWVLENGGEDELSCSSATACCLPSLARSLETTGLSTYFEKRKFIILTFIMSFLSFLLFSQLWSFELLGGFPFLRWYTLGPSIRSYALSIQGRRNRGGQRGTCPPYFEQLLPVPPEHF